MNTRKEKALRVESVGFGQKVQDYKLLVKFRLNITVVFSALMAYAIVVPVFDLKSFVVLALGGFFVTGAANALNQVIEKDFDKMMTRTADRPIAAGRMNVSEAVLAAGLMSVVGIFCLATFNPLTAFLGTISFLLYAFVYTPLKRVSPISVLVGAIPGALPMMIGVVAYTGGLTPLAFLLFGVQFFWQMPHFWAIGWLGYTDYKKAGFKMTPDTGDKPSNALGWQSALFALMLVPVSLSTYFLELNSLPTALILAAAALIYAWYGFNLYRQNNRETARKLMFSSFFLPTICFGSHVDR